MSSDRILTGTPVGDVVGHEMIGEHITDTITKDKKKVVIQQYNMIIQYDNYRIQFSRIKSIKDGSSEERGA